MDYSHAAYVADRKTLGFKGFGLTTPAMLALQLLGLEAKRGTPEWPAIEAAYARQTAWIASNQTVPMPPAEAVANPANRSQPTGSNAGERVADPPKQADPTPEELAGLAAWRAELANRLVRHRRRRGRYPQVAPP